jgi:hypothetical protein
MGSSSAPFPYEFPTAVAEVKPTWSSQWTIEPRFQNITFSRHVGSVGAGSAELPLAYGSIMYQWETSHTTYESVDYSGWWVRISFVGEQGLQPQWVGQIQDQDRIVLGSDDEKSGFQTWVAYDAMGMLDKKSMSTSFWFEAGEGAEVKELNFVPAMNRLDKFGRVKGNRIESVEPSSQSFMYGGKEVWSRVHYIDYVLRNFADDSGISGPEWILTGELDSLIDMTDVVEFGKTQTVLEVLKKLIGRNYGLDFRVIDYSEGFEINVFATQDREINYGVTTLPPNNDVIRIQVGETKDLIETRIVNSSTTKHNKIRIIGERTVVCFSLLGATASVVSSPLEEDDDETLVPKWDSDQEEEYDDGDQIGAFPEDSDNWRLSHEYDNVYLRFGAPEEAQEDKPDQGVQSVPIMNTDGSLPDDEEVELAPVQRTMRHTLDWIPLKSNIDYTLEPDDDDYDRNPDEIEPDTMAPLIWIWDSWNRKTIQIQKTGIGFEMLDNEWGFRLLTKHNHIMALTHWDGGDDTWVQPLYDYEGLIATIAVEADHSLVIEHELSNDNGTTYEISAPGAELWLLAPHTQVKVDNDDTGKTLSSGDKWIELRNDAESLHPLMAGLIARFETDRAKGDFRFAGYREWGYLLGSILGAVEDTGDTYDINGVITSISFANNETTIRTGYA